MSSYRKSTRSTLTHRSLDADDGSGSLEIEVSINEGDNGQGTGTIGSIQVGSRSPIQGRLPTSPSRAESDEE